MTRVGTITQTGAMDSARAESGDSVEAENVSPELRACPQATPPFGKGGIGGICCWLLLKIPLNPPLLKGDPIFIYGQVLSPLRPREVIHKLEAAGFRLRRQTGSQALHEDTGMSKGLWT